MRHDLKKGYKVLQVYDGRLYSFNQNFYCYKGAGLLLYKEGEQAKPMKLCGPLAVFNNLPDAEALVKQYLFSLSKLVIHECLYAESTKRAMYASGYGPSLGRNGKRFDDCYPLSEAPQGTALATVVIIGKRIR